MPKQGWTGNNQSMPSKYEAIENKNVNPEIAVSAKGKLLRRWTSPDVVSKMPRLADNSQLCAKWWLRGSCTSNCERASSHTSALPRTVQPAFDKWVAECRERFDQAWQSQNMDGTKGSNAPNERLSQQKNMHFVPDDHGDDPFVLPPEPKKIHIHVSHLLSTKQDNLNEQAHKLREQITRVKNFWQLGCNR